MPSRGEWVQFIIATAIGCIVFAAMEGETSKARTFGALVSGYFGMKLAVFLCVWARFGWKAARSMKLEP